MAAPPETEIPRGAIFYANGTHHEFGGPDDELVPIWVSRAWLEAPSDGVIAVSAAQDYTGRHMLRGDEFYYPLLDGSYEVGMCNNLHSFIRTSGLVKCGSWVGSKAYPDGLRRAARWGEANIPAYHGERDPVYKVDLPTGGVTKGRSEL